MKAIKRPIVIGMALLILLLISSQGFARRFSRYPANTQKAQSGISSAMGQHYESIFTDKYPGRTARSRQDWSTNPYGRNYPQIPPSTTEAQTVSQPRTSSEEDGDSPKTDVSLLRSIPRRVKTISDGSEVPEVSEKPAAENFQMREAFSDERTDAILRGEYPDFNKGGATEAPGLLGYFAHGNDCVTLEYLYTGEVFSNMRGGANTRNATTYFGLFEMTLTADLDRIGIFPGGTFFMYGLNAHGREISNYVGDYQGLSNIQVAPYEQIMQVEEYWWEKWFCDDTIMLRLGKTDANYDFAVVEVAGDFINSSFGYHPTIPMPTYPNAAMGAIMAFQLTDTLLFRAGVWDGESIGKLWGFSGTGKTFSMYEFEKMWDINGHPGEFHVGLWYHSSDWDDLRTGDTHGGNHGINVGIEHMIYRECNCPDNYQGLAVFGQYGWAPDDRSEVEEYYGIGLVYLGLLNSRDDDVTGLAIASVNFSTAFEAVGISGDEMAIEFFYKAQLTPYIMIQPDFQYIVNPGGQFPDAFVGGMRFEVLL